MPVHFPHLPDPAIYPDYRRRPVRVPTWKTFGNATQLTTLRGFTIQDRRLAEFAGTLDAYVEEHKLGRVIWPNFENVFAENFNDLVAEIKRRGLYLFDIWGHVPGSEPLGWGHVVPLPGQVKYLERMLGPKFLGFDNGEQDGRYIGGYANRQCPAPSDRFRQYLNFQRFFERMGDDLGNHLSALVSLSYGHYFLKEGNHVLLGAETAQGLPNSQVYYAFIRGACKQYGILWFGNASVWNRWGWKSYPDEGGPANEPYGPDKGTSTNLLKRLIYTHYLYNCVAVGFESSWFLRDQSHSLIGSGGAWPTEKHTLSPIGQIQTATGRFIAEHGQPGTMHAPAALLLDHFAGWCVPRHLYTRSVYLVWGSMPYEPGDYLTHGVLSLLYPGYEDSSYYRDERGFLSPTPYGDMADCLLSDVPGWVLAQYGLVVAAGKLSVDAELRDKLTSFVQRGGHLVVTADNARALWPGWQIGEPMPCPAGSTICWIDGAEDEEPSVFGLCTASGPDRMNVLATCGERPAVVEVPLAEGQVTLLLSPLGLPDKPDLAALVASEIDQPLPCPFPLLRHVRRALDRALASQQLFSVGDGLAFVTCRKTRGEYTLGIYNNGLSARPFQIASHAGAIKQVVELPLDQSEKGQAGYWPEQFQDNDPGVSNGTAIAGGDIRLFRVTIDETNLRLLEPVKPRLRAQPRLLALRDIADLKTEILRRPTFFQHFDGVKIDWTYLRIRDRKQLRREAGWLKRQKVRLVADFTPGLNFYPDLTLLDTFAPRYEESVTAIDDCLDKMKALGAADAVIALHRNAENHVSPERAEERFTACVADLCRRAAKRRVTLHLQNRPDTWHPTAKEMLAFIAKVAASLEPAVAARLRYALNTSHAAISGEPVADIIAAAGDRLGLVLLSAPGKDVAGQLHDAHRPLADTATNTAAFAALKFTLVLDADYRSWDEVYADVRLFE